MVELQPGVAASGNGFPTLNSSNLASDGKLPRLFYGGSHAIPIRHFCGRNRCGRAAVAGDFCGGPAPVIHMSVGQGEIGAAIVPIRRHVPPRLGIIVKERRHAKM